VENNNLVKIPWGIPLDKSEHDVHIAWGFRGIHNTSGYGNGFDTLPDRQGWYQKEENQDEKNDLAKFINENVMPKLQDEAKNFLSSDSDRKFMEFENGPNGKKVHAVITPNSSYGYIYGSVWYGER